MPVEKSWLAGRDPIAGFGSDEGRRRFARRIAGRLERPALPQSVHDLLVRPLRRWLDRAGSQVQELLADAGVEFRLRFQAHAHGVGSCEMLVVGRRGRVPQPIVDKVDEWWAALPKGEGSPVVLLGCRYGTSEELTMGE